MRIAPGRQFATGEVLRLVAPALDATAGVRFGGAAVVFDMPGASAAIVTLPVA